MSDTFVIVGLGNPGQEYADTRHNAGFMAIDILAQQLNVRYWKTECGCLVGKASYQGRDLVLAKPQSFMNLSGGPVKQLLAKYEIDVDHLIVIHDEIDLDGQTIRVKFGGGHAGHNGLRSIIDKLCTADWYRVRVGVGRGNEHASVADYVLSSPKGSDDEAFKDALDRAAKAALSLVDEGLIKTQQTFN